MIRIKRKCLSNFGKTVILKPDKGNGIVVINITEYNLPMKNLFSDQSEFKVIQKDPTLTPLKTVQNYVNTMLKRNKISEEEKKQLRPMAAQGGRAHGIPKTHKAYANLPSFRTIIDTTCTPYYNNGKFLSSLLQPLTHNDYNLKDSFDAVKRIRSIPPELFDNGYQFVSFDVQSLFTNVPVKKTINIILDRVYNKKLININLKKRTMKRLLVDSCTKTAFSFDNVLYELCDGVSMGSPLGPVLANIILTEFENVIVKPLIETSVLNFYCRYLDDTLLLIKKHKIQHVLNSFNSFDKIFCQYF